MPSLKHDYARLLNQARVQLPGATDAGLQQALFDVFQDFFKYTGMWKSTITVPIVANTSTYEIVDDAPGEIVRLDYTLGSQPASNPITIPSWLSNDRTQLILRDTPNTDDTYVAHVVKTCALPITKDAEVEIPDYVLPVWAPCILAGLLANMMLQKNKPYSDPQMAMFNIKRFENGKQDCKASTITGHVTGAQAWQFPGRWGRGSQRGGVSTR